MSLIKNDILILEYDTNSKAVIMPGHSTNFHFPERAVMLFMEKEIDDSGKKAYIMNMYTAPEYRRQGIAIHTLDLLVKCARKLGMSQIALEATDMGRPLYERYGFVKMEDEMELI